MRRITAIAACLALLTLSAVACAGKSLDDIPAETTNEVAVEDNSFQPRVIQVTAGTTVTWEWTGNGRHDVAGSGWASPIQDEGDFELTFDTPGSFDYKCQLHPGMTGRVVVTP